MAVVQYTAAEEKRIENVLVAFKEYINDNRNFDILFSHAFGYFLWIPATVSNDDQYRDGQYSIIREAQDLFEQLFWEMHTDLIFELREKDLSTDRFEPEDIDALHRRVESYIETLTENKETLQTYLEKCIKKVKEDPYIV